MSDYSLKHSVTQLYTSPATCLVIYRILPPLAKFFYHGNGFQRNEVPLLDLDKWVNLMVNCKFQNAIKSMKSLHLLIPNKSSGTFDDQPKPNIQNQPEERINWVSSKLIWCCCRGKRS
ncbi:ANM_HP_G0101620.mRNA.1.CDS.1 [Saccharomyces cerevisiae]|nr:ANM_HP_G0101620.mRNA.1.CDS.1 [Saccharomyces cerevisiae]CAI6413017.1 ANM_HP_G0101620.mRNA.1.CDS.1 [Saccharomyces cerevisiae]